MLVFAGSDPTGGAGLQADLLAVTARGGHALTVVTAITVQDTKGVDLVQPLDATLVAAQARRVIEDIPVRAVKIGLLGSVEVANVVVSILAELRGLPVVLDPVLASGRGDALANDALAAAICTELAPYVTVMTPNSIEARRLAFGAMDPSQPLDAAAERLRARGAQYVLITGTHEPTDEVVNTLYGPDGIVCSDRWPRLPESYHGSGCTLAAAIAAELAKGKAVPEAAREAQAYTWQALARGFRPGRGQYLPDRIRASKD